MQIHPQNTLKKSLSLAVCLFFYSLVGIAEPPKLTPKDLTPSERAVYEMFLTRRPRFQFALTPDSIAKNETYPLDALSEEVVDGLTPESFARICEVVPKLKDWVESGKQFRIDYVNGVTERAEKYVFEKRNLDRNYSARLVASYNAFLRSLKHRKKSNPDRQIIENNVRAEIENRYAYPSGSSFNSWEPQAKRDYYRKVEFLMDEEVKKKPITELPKDLFQQWRKAELQRLTELQQNNVDVELHLLHILDKIPAGDLRIFGDAYTESHTHDLLKNNYSDLNSAIGTLKSFSDPEKQETLIHTLEVGANREREGYENYLKRMYGGPDKEGGIRTSVRNSNLSWLYNLGWEGRARLIEKKQIKDPNWDYWTERARKSKGWIFRRAPIEKILKPEEYAEQQRAKWQKRLKQVSTWSKRVAAIIAITVGGYNYGNDAIKLGNNLWEGITQKARPSSGGNGNESLSYSANMSYSDLPKPVYRKSPSPLAKQELVSKVSDNSPSAENYSEEQISESGGMPAAYRFVPKEKKLKEIPLEFELVNLDTANGSIVSHENPKDTPLDFEIETGGPHIPVKGIVMVPTPDKYDVRVDVWRDGKRLEYQDFNLMRNPQGTYFIKLSSDELPQKITYIARYYPDSSRRLSITKDASILPAMELTDLAWLSAFYKEENITPISDALDKQLSEAIENNTPVRPEKVIQIIADNHYYSHRPGKLIPAPDPRNPISAFRDFPRTKDNHLCLQCTGGSELGKDSLNLRNDPNQKAETGKIIQRKPEQSQVFSGHKRIYVSLYNSPDKVVLDATASEKDPEEKPEETLAEKESRSLFERILARLTQYRPTISSLSSSNKEQAHSIQQSPSTDKEEKLTKKDVETIKKAIEPKVSAEVFDWLKGVIENAYQQRFEKEKLLLTPRHMRKRRKGEKLVEDDELAKQALEGFEPGEPLETAVKKEENGEKEDRNTPSVSEKTEKKADPTPKPIPKPFEQLFAAPETQDVPLEDEVETPKDEVHRLALLELKKRKNENNIEAGKILRARQAENLANAKKEQERRRIKNKTDAEAELKARKDRNAERDRLVKSMEPKEEAIANRAEKLELSHKDSTYPHRRALILSRVLKKLLQSTSEDFETLSKELRLLGITSPKHITNSQELQNVIEQELKDIHSKVKFFETQALEDPRNEKKTEKARYADGTVIKPTGEVEFPQGKLMSKINDLMDYLSNQHFTPREEENYEKILQQFQLKNPEDFEPILKAFREKNPEDFHLIRKAVEQKNPENLELIIGELKIKNWKCGDFSWLKKNRRISP